MNSLRFLIFITLITVRVPSHTLDHMQSCLLKPTMNSSSRSLVGLSAIAIAIFVSIMTAHFLLTNSDQYKGVVLKVPNPSASNTKQHMCLSLDFGNDMDELISKYKQIHFIMLPKGGGRSFKTFALECMKSKNSVTKTKTNFIGSEDTTKKFFTSSFELPSLTASHIHNAYALSDLVTHATKESLIIFSHRERSDRRRSAIMQVAHERCDKKNCHRTEQEMIDFIVEEKVEIKHDVNRLLNCESYKAIEDNAPNLVFMDFKQADKMTTLLAKHFCPEQKPFHVNENSDKFPVWVELKNGTDVHLEDWIHAKSEWFDLAFRVTGSSCQSTTRKIENDLLSCPDKTLHISSSDGLLNEHLQKFQ
jgi:hypothetical protein